jgi:hypothetical protein
MPYFEFLWTDSLIQHIEEHGVSQDDFEHVVCNPASKGYSRASHLSASWGYTMDGRYVMAVHEVLDQVTILPVTAYEVREPR